MQLRRILSTIFLTALFAITVAPTFAGAAAPGELGFVAAPACKASFSQNVFLAASTNLSALSPQRVFQGCWTLFPAGPCRAIYSKKESYQICGECDDFGNPGSGNCSAISQQTLNQGYWCS